MIIRKCRAVPLGLRAWLPDGRHPSGAWIPGAHPLHRSRDASSVAGNDCDDLADKVRSDSEAGRWHGMLTRSPPLQVLGGDRAALARAITLVESGRAADRAPAAATLQRVLAARRGGTPPLRVGIAGPPARLHSRTFRRQPCLLRED